MDKVRAARGNLGVPVAIVVNRVQASARYAAGVGIKDFRLHSDRASASNRIHQLECLVALLTYRERIRERPGKAAWQHARQGSIDIGIFGTARNRRRRSTRDGEQVTRAGVQRSASECGDSGGGPTEE